MRPKGLLCVLCLPLIGYGWGHWDYALPARGLDELVFVMLAWTCFHCGSMWMNAYLDRDECDVIFGTATHVPPWIPSLSFVTFLIGIGICCAVSWWMGGIGVVVALSGWLYSSRIYCLKGHATGGPLVNAVGYGLLSPLAGWLIVDVAMNPRTAVTSAVLLMGVMGSYFCLQGYQYDEDRKRGYRTLVATHGVAITLGVGRTCFGIVVLLILLMAIVGWYPSIVVCTVPVWLWFDRWIMLWRKAEVPEDIFWPSGFVRRATALGVFFFLCVFGVYIWDSFSGQSVAGFATPAGHPF